jgi:hypothetical protein
VVSAPRTVTPVLRKNPPTTLTARIGRAFDLPFAFNRHMAPGAITHKWHQFFARTFLVRTARGVAFVGILPRRIDFKTTTVTPGAIGPIAFQPAVATRAIKWKSGLARVFLPFVTAPRAGNHRLGHWALTFAARAGCPQGGPKTTLELFTSQGLPA